MKLNFSGINQAWATFGERHSHARVQVGFCLHGCLIKMNSGGFLSLAATGIHFFGDLPQDGLGGSFRGTLTEASLNLFEGEVDEERQTKLVAALEAAAAKAGRLFQAIRSIRW